VIVWLACSWVLNWQRSFIGETPRGRGPCDDRDGAVNVQAWIVFGLKPSLHFAFYADESPKSWANDSRGTRFIAWLKKSRQILGRMFACL
jgi:hypothetical protein